MISDPLDDFQKIMEAIKYTGGMTYEGLKKSGDLQFEFWKDYEMKEAKVCLEKPKHCPEKAVLRLSTKAIYWTQLITCWTE